MNTKKTQYEGKLGKYYIEEKQTLQLPNTPIRKLDENGILLYKIPYTSNYDHYPVEIALYALGNFETFLDSTEEQYRDIFLKQTDWLVNSIVVKDGFGVWEHAFTLPYYNFDRTPWVHGMAQGLAISALLRAYQLTDNTIYLETAEKAYRAFEVDIENGGVKFIDSNGDIWLEEYGILPPAHILNGFIFALCGVYEFYLVTGEKSALDLWEYGIKTLENNLNKYDLGYWSLYNFLHEYPATKSYHTLHIEQLKVLYELTKKGFFLEYASRWGDYLNKPLNRSIVIFKRGVIHVKQKGIKSCVDTYFRRRSWLRK